MAARDPPPPTILAHKTAFLAAQTLQLSQPLAASHAWQQRNNSSPSDPSAASHPHLPQKTLDDALFRLNHLLQQHSRRVYAPQASRHVAEQIERLLLDSADRYIAGRRGGDGGAPGDEDGDRDTLREEDALRVGADLTNNDIISSLPSTWAEVRQSEADAHPAEAQRYTELVTQLQTLAARRTEAQQRVSRLRRIEALMQPFSQVHSEKEGEALGVVQENMVTRNGDIEKELERMRMLLVRVSGRLAQLPNPPGGGVSAGRDVRMRDGDENGGEAGFVQDLDMVERNKVDALLGAF